MARRTLLQTMIDSAEHIMRQPDYCFEDFIQVFSGLDKPRAALFANQILEEILESIDDKQPYSDQIHLYSRGDFNLTIKVVGHEQQGAQLCINEFDMLVVNLGDATVLLPVYGTDADTDYIHRSAVRLVRKNPVKIEPYQPCVFKAYSEIVDLNDASCEAPFLVVHSMARGATTWVFDRDTLEPVNLTANHLQSSRIQIAARVLGEIGSNEDIDSLEQLAYSDYLHFVRWEAAESVYKLDPSRGRRLLEEYLINDVNPSIRNAARLTLYNISGENQRES